MFFFVVFFITIITISDFVFLKVPVVNAVVTHLDH